MIPFLVAFAIVALVGVLLLLYLTSFSDGPRPHPADVDFAWSLYQVLALAVLLTMGGLWAWQCAGGTP